MFSSPMLDAYLAEAWANSTSHTRRGTVKLSLARSICVAPERRFVGSLSRKSQSHVDL
jgi:hypothetical protein